MKLIRWMAPCVALVATAASAVDLKVTPANPTTADTLVLEVNNTDSCASIVPNTLEMTDGRVIRVTFHDGRGIACLVATPQPLRVALGRLPAGSYVVQLVPAPGSGTAAVVGVSVVNPTPSSPPDNYGGAWAVQGQSDGVFVDQSGKAAFISWLYHGADGKTSWAVMPEAKWEAGTDGVYRFRGALYKTDVLGTGVPGSTGTLVSYYIIGMGDFTPGSNFDEASFKVELAGESVARDFRLQRLRF